jgi:hypothetical protein
MKSPASDQRQKDTTHHSYLRRSLACRLRRLAPAAWEAGLRWSDSVSADCDTTTAPTSNTEKAPSHLHAAQQQLPHASRHSTTVCTPVRWGREYLEAVRSQDAAVCRGADVRGEGVQREVDALGHEARLDAHTGDHLPQHRQAAVA